MMEIGCADGYSADTAAKIVTNNAGDIGRIYWLAAPTIGEPSRHDIWIGYLGYTDQDGRSYGGWNVGGDLDTVLQKVKANGEQQKARLVLVNASAVLRDIRNTAARLKIDFPVPANWQ